MFWYSSDSIVIIQSEEHIGPGGARNLAIQYARSPYVTKIDSDDWVEADCLEKMYTIASENKCDIVCCNSYRDFGDGHLFPMKRFDEDRLITIDTLERRKELIVLGTLTGHMLADRRYLLDNEICYPEGIVYEDLCWNALNCCYIKRMYVMEDYLYHYFVNSDSVVMKQKQDYSHDMFVSNYIKWNELVGRGV